MSRLLFSVLLALSFTFALAKIELEFVPPEGVKAPPAVLAEARHVLQKRLEHFLAPGQTFSVTPRAKTLIVRFESSEDLEANQLEGLIDLCTTLGRLEFVDSETALESGERFTGSGEVIFTDQDIRTTSATTSEFGTAIVQLELTSEGSDKLAAYSKNNLGHFLVIVKDGEVLSSPIVQSEISGGQVWLQNNFTLEEARRLAAELTGRLPILLELLRQN